MKMNPSHKKTLILVIVLLLCAAFASFWTARQNQKNDAAVAVITYQGKDIRTVDLSTVFCKMCVTICGRFRLNEGGVAGFVC